MFPAKSPVIKIPLVRNGKSIKKTYCAFRKKTNSDGYMEDFARILRSCF